MPRVIQICFFLSIQCLPPDGIRCELELQVNPSSCESSVSYTREIDDSNYNAGMQISERTSGKIRQRRRMSSRKRQGRKRSSSNKSELSSDVVVEGSVSVTLSANDQSQLSLVRSGHASNVSAMIHENIPESEVHQLVPNVVGSYQSGTNCGVIDEELPLPDVNGSGVSASMIVTPTDVHQCGLIPVSSKDASLNVQENDSMELCTAANGSDDGLTLVNETPMEGFQSGLSLNTSGEKVTEIDLIEL